ncbi:MAG: enoyl-CoA hydratase/isomerase family protein [Planctomycetota bacterium]
MIRLDRDNGVVRIVLDRPERRNALTPDGLRELAKRIGDLERDGDRAMLLAGEGRAFCAGFDLDACVGPHGDANLASLLANLSAIVAALRALPIPVVAAVQGAAIAGGCALLGGADVVVASPDAKLGYPVTRLGISPAVTAPFLASIGWGPARARLLDPGLIDGRRAHDVGLVHELADDPAARAMEIAGSLAAKPPHALRETKRWMNELMPANAAAGLAASLALVGSDESHQMLGAALAR